MDNKKMKISKELLESLSLEEVVDLKIEVDELVSKLDDMLEACNLALNS